MTTPTASNSGLRAWHGYGGEPPSRQDFPPVYWPPKRAGGSFARDAGHSPTDGSG